MHSRIHNVFLKFNNNGSEKLFSVEFILFNGIPINADTGNDMELVDQFLYGENGERLPDTGRPN